MSCFCGPVMIDAAFVKRLCEKLMSSVQIWFPRGMSMKKAGKAIHGAKNALESAGYLWENAQMHEHEVNLLQRFLVDCSMSSGLHW